MCDHLTVVFHRCTQCDVSMVQIEQEHTPNVTIPNLTKYRIPPEVRNKAMQIYNNQMQVDQKKGTKKKELEFYIIYCAYKELGIQKDPIVIARMVGINKNSIGKAHASFSVSVTGYKPPILIGDAPTLIPEFCTAIGCIEADKIKEIRDMSRKIIEYRKDISEHSPHKLAAAFIQAYFDCKDYRLDRQRLCELVNVTEGTLGSIVKIVREIMNELQII